MTGMRRTLGLVVALAACSSPAWASVSAHPASAWAREDAQELFKQGVDLLERGRRDQALQVFQKVLAMGLSQEQAYALWQGVGDRAMTELLVEGGEFELVAKRLLELSRAGRRQHRNDAAMIQPLVATVTSASTEPIERRKALLQLSSEHGEYAVPYLIPLLAGGADDERRVQAMQALTRMGSDVVPPLLAALDSDDAMLRRSISFVLGTIGDPRSAGALLWLAANDKDGAVQAAAREAAGRMGVKGTPLAHFLELGDAYHHQRDSVLRPHDYSDVVWTWSDGKLNPVEVPRFLYSDELAKRAYERALISDPSSTEALAGLARAYVSEQTKIAERERSGADVTAWKPIAQDALTALHAAGVEALDLALRWSVEGGDSPTAGALARVLGPLCNSPCPGLSMALSSPDGAVRSEAAVALGRIALRTGATPDAHVVDLLTEAAGREVTRVAIVIDADQARGQALTRALETQGVYANYSSSGQRGLSMLRRSPALDVVLIAESLPDVTAAQLVDELRADERTANVPVVMISKSAEEAAATWGDKIVGSVTGASDLQAVEQALTKQLSGDRAMAEDLAHRAAQVLADLGRSGRADLGRAASALAPSVASRNDALAVTLLQVIGSGGTAEQVPALLALVEDDKREEGTRAAAADALSAIFGRNPAAAGREGAARLQAVASSATSQPVRDAVARALALMQLDPAARAELLRKLRSGSGGGSGSSGGASAPQGGAGN